jgi:hypothetical protein
MGGGDAVDSNTDEQRVRGVVFLGGGATAASRGGRVVVGRSAEVGL